MTKHHVDPAMKIDSLGDLVAAVPALLGFYPTRSVVLLAHDEVTGRIGATAEYFGAPGSAQSAKVALNAFYGAFQAGLAESLAQLGADGVDLDAFQRVIAPVDYREWVDLTVDGWRAGTDAGFRMDLLLKDMRLALAARRDLGTGTAGAEAVVEVLERACAAGLDRTGVAALASTLGPPDDRGAG